MEAGDNRKKTMSSRPKNSGENLVPLPSTATPNPAIPNSFRKNIFHPIEA